LFASLPAELKLALRTQTVEPYINDTVEVKTELLDVMEADGLLPTQPREISPDSPIQIEIRQEFTPLPSTSAPVDLAPPIASGSVVIKRTHENAIPSSSKRNSTSRDWAGHNITERGKRRKGKSRALDNRYQGHPWDCTGLVPRYTDYSEAPPELGKCELSPLPLIINYTEEEPMMFRFRSETSAVAKI